MRSKLSPAFTSAKMKQMLPVMSEIGSQLTSSLVKQIRKSKSKFVIGIIDISLCSYKAIYYIACYFLPMNLLSQKISTLKWQWLIMFVIELTNVGEKVSQIGDQVWESVL